MKNFSNLYIFGFASVMVIVVAAILSFVATKLKPLQQKNIKLERMTDILSSVDKMEGVEDAEDEDAFVINQYDQFITESFVVNSDGEMVEGLDAFEITTNIQEEFDKPPSERNLPVFVFTGEEGQENYIIPLRGKGLWGPIWGYVALKDDFTTISGAVFDHSQETPGLGAEINEEWFEEAFEGKTIFDEEGNFTSVQVVKGEVEETAPHSVDAISGGTITSKGLEDMLYNGMKPYTSFFKERMN